MTSFPRYRGRSNTELFERAGRAEPLGASAPPQKRRRRVDLATVADAIASGLKKSALGVSAEELRRAVGLDKARFVRGVRFLISAGRVRKTGLRRGTRYFAAAAAPQAAEGKATGTAAKVTRKPAAKKRAAKRGRPSKARKARKAPAA